MDFAELKKETANDCRVFADMLKDLADEVEQGDMAQFEMFFIEGGTEEGDSKINELRERIILRYLAKSEKSFTGKGEEE